MAEFFDFILSFLRTTSSFIDENKALIVLVGIPLITMWVTQKSSEASAERASHTALVDRRLRSQMRIAEFRQVWINDLREAFIDIIENCSKPIRSANDDYPVVMARVARIELMMNSRDPDYEKLRVLLNQLRSQDHSNVHTELIVVSQAILKREWDRLRNDLARIEQGEV